MYKKDERPGSSVPLAKPPRKLPLQETHLIGDGGDEHSAECDIAGNRTRCKGGASVHGLQANFIRFFDA